MRLRQRQSRALAGGRRRPRKRSPVATPATHAISPPEITTGSARGARAEPWVGEEVLQRASCRRGRAGASGRPARQARTSSVGRERAASSVPSPSGRSGRLALSSPPPKRAAGTGSEAGAGGGGAARALEAQPPVLRHRAQAAAEVERRAAAAAAEREQLVQAAADRRRPRDGAVGEPPARQPSQRPRQRRKRASPSASPAPANASPTARPAPRPRRAASPACAGRCLRGRYARNAGQERGGCGCGH